MNLSPGTLVKTKNHGFAKVIRKRRRVSSGASKATICYDMLFVNGKTEWTQRMVTMQFSRFATDTEVDHFEDQVSGEFDYSSSTKTEEKQDTGAEHPTEEETRAKKTEEARAKDPLGATLAESLMPYVIEAVREHGLDMEEVSERVQRKIDQITAPRDVHIYPEYQGPPKNMGVQHAMFETILKVFETDEPIWINGPAGSGKTSVVRAVAEAMGVAFRSVSVCATTSKAELMGYRNVATGEYVRSEMRDAYEYGGVILLDECDAANPNVLLCANNLAANDVTGFPDGMVRRHKDFRLAAAANTIGRGGDAQYVGRNQIDAATLNRYTFLYMGYDPHIEAAMTGLPPSCFEYKGAPTAIKFKKISSDEDRIDVEAECRMYAKKLMGIREAISALKVRHIVSPRGSNKGIKMLRHGFPMKAVMEMVVWQGLDRDTVKKIQKHEAVTG